MLSMCNGERGSGENLVNKSSQNLSRLTQSTPWVLTGWDILVDTCVSPKYIIIKSM